MIFYGLADLYVREIIEFYESLEEAEATLAEVLEDEPDFEPILCLARVDFGGSEPTVEFV